jgi:hypothetical protein
MSDYFDIVPPQSVVPTPPSPGEVARGNWWSLFKREEGYVLEYISGEHNGRLKQLVVSEREAQQLVCGEADVEQLIIAHGVS